MWLRREGSCISMYGVMIKKLLLFNSMKLYEKERGESKMNYHHEKLENGISKGLGEIASDIQDNSHDKIKQRSEIAKQIHNIRCFMDTFDKEMDKYKNGNVDNKSDAAISMKYAVVIINDVIADMEPAVLTKEQLMEINDIEKKMKEAENFVNTELPEEVLKDFEDNRKNRWPF